MAMSRRRPEARLRTGRSATSCAAAARRTSPAIAWWRRRPAGRAGGNLELKRALLRAEGLRVTRIDDSRFRREAMGPTAASEGGDANREQAPDVNERNGWPATRPLMAPSKVTVLTQPE
jgi:hypothetical protein